MSFKYCQLCPQNQNTSVDELYRKGKPINKKSYIGICCELHSINVYKIFDGLSDEEFVLEQDIFQSIRLLSLKKWMKIKEFAEEVEDEYKVSVAKINETRHKNKSK